MRCQHSTLRPVAAERLESRLILSASAAGIALLAANEVGQEVLACPPADSCLRMEPLWLSDDCLPAPPEQLETPLVAGGASGGQLPYGATDEDTSEFMIGDVWVTLVLMESDGGIDPNVYDWTQAEIDQVKSAVAEGLSWWEMLYHQGPPVAPKGDLTFHIDFTYADDPVPTGYEPTSNRAPSSPVDGLWIEDFLTYVGYNTPERYVSDMKQWDTDQRRAHGADWAFTVFIVNGWEFTDGWSGFAKLGGPYFVLTRDIGGWGLDRMDRIVAHETGHIFYALDEYPGQGSYNDHSGYYRTQNLNAYDDNPDPDSRVPSIMAEAYLLTEAFYNYTSSPTSLEMLGWLDSDADGVFDVLDVPLSLSGAGYYEPVAGVFQFGGISFPGLLDNLNPKGLHHDISVNTIDRVQYRLDDGPWIDAGSYGSYSAYVVQATPVTPETQTVEFRTIDLVINYIKKEFQSQVV